MNDADAPRLFSKVAWRLLPVLILAYIFNYLDRNNIGFAALTMNQEIGLTATQFGRGAGILFLGYCFLEVPSNMILYRVGARRWIARIMISWGLISAATIFVSGPRSFYLLRFLLGAAEAGFFPGVAFYIGHWFPAEYRTRVIAWFMVAIPISSVIGGALSGSLLQMDGIAGLAGWKWLFILEGLPVVDPRVRGAEGDDRAARGRDLADRGGTPDRARPRRGREAAARSPPSRAGAQGSARADPRRRAVRVSRRARTASASGCRRSCSSGNCRISRSDS